MQFYCLSIYKAVALLYSWCNVTRSALNSYFWSVAVPVECALYTTGHNLCMLLPIKSAWLSIFIWFAGRKILFVTVCLSHSWVRRFICLGFVVRLNATLNSCVTLQRSFAPFHALLHAYSFQRDLKFAASISEHGHARIPPSIRLCRNTNASKFLILTFPLTAVIKRVCR